MIILMTTMSAKPKYDRLLVIVLRYKEKNKEKNEITLM